jgi:hypothetical protein
MELITQHVVNQAAVVTRFPAVCCCHCDAEFLHVKPGKGAAFVRTKLKNLLSNSNQEKTFRGGETVGLADVQRREAQFTYLDGEEVRCAVW